jgi:hypothetical protein
MFKHPGNYYADRVLLTTDQDERTLIKVRAWAAVCGI